MSDLTTLIAVLLRQKTSWFLNYWIFFSRIPFTVNVLLMLASIIFCQHRMKPWRRIPVLLLISYMSTWNRCNSVKWEQHKEVSSSIWACFLYLSCVCSAMKILVNATWSSVTWKKPLNLFLLCVTDSIILKVTFNTRNLIGKESPLF